MFIGVMGLSEKIVMKVLRDFGLTDGESQVYIFLAKNGILRAGDISKSLKKHKAQIYRILRNLQNTGIVESTLESPARFSAVSFESLIDLIIKKKKEEMNFLREGKGDLLTYWMSISSEKPAPIIDRFVIFEGRSSMYSRILQMIEEAEKEVLAVTTSLGVIRADQAGIIDAMKKRHIHFRILVQVSKENLETVKKIAKEVFSKYPNIEGRHVNLPSSICPRFIVKDEEEAIFSITLKEDSTILSDEEVSLWTNSRGFAIIYAKAFFEEMWKSSTVLNSKIDEIETGKCV